MDPLFCFQWHICENMIFKVASSITVTEELACVPFLMIALLMARADVYKPGR